MGGRDTRGRRAREHASVAFISKQDSIGREGTISDVLPNATFRVLVPSRHNVLSTLAGSMRRNRIRVLVGDRATIVGRSGGHLGIDTQQYAQVARAT